MNHNVHHSGALEPVKPVRIIHDRLTPSESCHKQQDRSYGIKVSKRVHRQTAHIAGRAVTEPVSNKCVHELMNGE